MLETEEPHGGTARDRGPSPVFVLDEDWRFTYVNEDAEGIFDTHRRKLEGKSFWAQIPDEMEESYREPFARALEGGEPTEFENRCPLTGRWYRFQVYPFEGRISVHAHDIEDRVRDDDALELRELSLRTAYEIVADRDRSDTESIRDVLSVLRSAIGTDVAAVSEVDLVEGTYLPQAVDTASTYVLPRTPVPLTEQPACAEVVRTGETLTRRDIEGGAGRSRAYLGTPIRVGEEIRGTLRFSSRQPRSEAFADWQVSYAEMFASWIGRVLEQGNDGGGQRV